MTDKITIERETLLPCPFCGAEAEIITLEGETDNPSIGAQCVQCTNSACGSAGGLIYPLMDDVRHLLLERWNRRTALAQKAEPPAPKDPVAQWQKRHHRGTEGKWENTDEHDAKWWRASSSLWDIRALYAAPQAWRPDIGEVVVTRNDAGEIVAVTRQDDDGRILSVIAEAQPAPSHRAPSHRLSDARMDLDSVEHMQGGANGPTIRLRGFINAQTGPTAPQPPIDNAFVADGCEQFSPPAEPAPVPCCGKYETCSHACTPRGRWLGRREAENERAESAQPLQNCLDVLETVTKHFTRTPSTLRDSQVRGMAHAAMKECRAAMIEAALQKIADFGQEQEQKPVAWIGLPGKGTPLFTAPPAPAAVPPGYVLVPIEPTQAILDAPFVGKVQPQDWHSHKRSRELMAENYRAMIAAAGDKP